MAINSWMVLALLAGVFTTFQSASNGSLARVVGAPAAVTLNTFIFLLLAIVYLAFEWSRGNVSLERWRELSWWQYLGGIFGFGVVLFLTISFPKLGALMAIVLVILGQSLAALFVDHHGLFNMPQVAVSLQRVFAVVLILSGVFLLRR
ncbi:MAG: DMT family transporter [Oligoflexia bacterium]|nr:DMT family transporter [Oligoflexia bacterium]